MNKIRSKEEIRSAFRDGDGIRKSPLKAIRAKCRDCCCGSTLDIRYCTATECPLHSFRFARNPFRKKRELTDDQRHAIATRLASGRMKSDRDTETD